MFQRNVMKALVGSVVLASLALTGCGSNGTPNATDPYADPYGNDGGYSDPYAGNTGGTNNGGYVNPGSNTGGYNNYPGTGPGTNMPVASNALTANVTVLKKGILLGKTKVKVDVLNSSQAQATGTLTVTFTKKGKATKYVQTKTVSIAPGGTQSFEFTGAMIGTDGANADVITDAPLPNVPMTGNTGTYNNGAYGNPTGY